MAKNIPNFYPDFIGERRTLMELVRQDNILAWQSEFRWQSPYPRELTNVIGLGLGGRGYILKGSLGFAPITENCHPQLA